MCKTGDLEAMTEPASNDVTDVEIFESQLGVERRKSEMRQLGALYMILGIGASHSALALKAILIDGMSGDNQIRGFKLPALVATIIQTSLGLVSIAVGFVTLLHTPTSPMAHRVAKITVFIVNLGPIAFIVTILRIVQGSKEPPEEGTFIPAALSPSQGDVEFVVAMGILALVSVCGTLIGGLTLVGLNLCAFLGNQPVDKHRGYYIIRLAYYCLLVLCGGVSQLMLGVYLGVRFGWGPFEDAVHVTVYTIFFPCIAVIVGMVQTSVAVYGWCRALRWIPVKRGDFGFLIATLISWLVTTSLQIVVQPSYGDEKEFDAEGATYSAVYLGFFVMPAWLDYLAMETPGKIEPSYYGLPSSVSCKEDFLCKVFGLTECADTLEPRMSTTTMRALSLSTDIWTPDSDRT